MMNDVTLFNSKEFGRVRTIDIDNKIYFIGIDIANILEYSVPSRAITTHCKGATKMVVPSKGGNQETWVITEGDVYRLIMKSKMPKAEQFESWVMDEILPQIRQTGGYIPIQEDDDELTILSKAFLIANKRQ